MPFAMPPTPPVVAQESFPPPWAPKAVIVTVLTQSGTVQGCTPPVYLKMAVWALGWQLLIQEPSQQIRFVPHTALLVWLA